MSRRVRSVGLYPITMITYIDVEFYNFSFTTFMTKISEIIGIFISTL